MVYIQWNTTQSQKRIKILPFAKTWVVLEGIMIREISQTEKDKYCITYTWTLKMQQTCEYNKKETDSQMQRTN